MLLNSLRMKKLYRRLYDDPNSGAGESGTGGAGSAGSDEKLEVIVQRDPKTQRPSYVGPDGKRLFTQEHMDTEIGRARTKATEQNRNAITELQKLRDAQGTSEEMRSALEQRIEEMKVAQMTEKQQYEHQLKQTMTKHETDLKNTISERDTWKNRFTEQTVMADIAKAASISGVTSMELFTAFVRPITTVAEVLSEDGKPTGQFKTEAEWIEKNDKGEEVKLKLPVEGVVAKMREDAVRFGALFRPNQQSGTGHSGFQSTKTMPKNLTHAEFLAWEKNNQGSSDDPRRL